jgi:hypothetical protein
VVYKIILHAKYILQYLKILYSILSTGLAEWFKALALRASR